MLGPLLGNILYGAILRLLQKVWSRQWDDVFLFGSNSESALHNFFLFRKTFRAELSAACMPTEYGESDIHTSCFIQYLILLY